MTPRPCIVVAGLGRCGSSMVMQMLDRAGVPCVGDFPAYETDASLAEFDPREFAARSETAIKILDAHRLPIGAMPHHVVIWLTRDATEQAKSAIKFMSLFLPSVTQDRATRRALAASFRHDALKAAAALQLQRGTPHLALQFEDMILRPTFAAQRIRVFLRQFGYDLDAEAMAAAVRVRSPKCLPGMLEFDLLEAKEPIVPFAVVPPIGARLAPEEVTADPGRIIENHLL